VGQAVIGDAEKSRNRPAEADCFDTSGENKRKSGLLLIAHARMKRVKEA